MKKRIKKKRRLGKFRAYGVEVKTECDFKGYSEKEIDEFFYGFLYFVEKKGWVMGGGFSDCFISDDNRNIWGVRRKYKNLTETDAFEIRGYLAEQPWCKKVIKCEIKDAWHGVCE